MNRRDPLLMAAVCCLLITACGRPPENPPPRCDEDICTVEEEGTGALRTVVNATSDDDWIYFDFESAGSVAVTDPQDSLAWDLAFQRMVVKSNGGVNGNGGVEVAIVDDETFDAIEVAPNDGWKTDVEGDPEARDPGGTVFNAEPAWYDYDLFSHSLQPKADRFYIIRTVEGNAFKMRFNGYYSADQEAAWPSFSWAAVATF